MATTKKAAAKKVVAKKAPAKKTTRGTGKGAAKAAAKSTVKATNAKKKEGGKRGRTSKYTEDMKIKVLATENPKRAGSEAYKIFELLKKSKTVGDFYAKGGGSHNLRWNEEREYIKVG